MYVSHVDKVKKEKVEMKGMDGQHTKGVWIQWLIREEQGAENYALRLFTLEPGGTIPKHQHPWEHEIFVLEGKGIIGAGDREIEVSAGNFAYIEPDIPHWYRNTGEVVWKFLCIIPIKK
ncbi:MAG: cupin domain-containing protein [Thermoplasmata archaeon]|nr:cupin domain-containing protein [Thermoplasmata archaeon]